MTADLLWIITVQDAVMKRKKVYNSANIILHV
jgi:hypothetical protein